MNPWSFRTAELAKSGNYLDRLQQIYMHEEGERDVPEHIIQSVRTAFESGDDIALLNILLNQDKFPYRDSYVPFLRRDRPAIDRNPETTARICGRLRSMGIERVIDGITQSKEANTRRGNSFPEWVRRNFNCVSQEEFVASDTGVVVLNASEPVALDFCNLVLRLGITKRPDIVAKTGSIYVVGEAKFSADTGGNQSRQFDDGIRLANNAAGSTRKVFILDGIFWIQTGTAQYKAIEGSSAPIFSALLLKDFLEAGAR